jgi:NAD(P)-dependent dehydrogenase (short-subunit alcohol dehydrogenase family)
MNFDFTGKTCLVVGASSGIGLELAIEYAKHGANLAIVSSNPSKLKKADERLEQIGVKALTVVADVSSKEQVDKAVTEVETHYGKIDVLANCAGTLVSKKMIDLEEDEWDRVIDVNLKSVYLLSRCVAKNMIKNKVKNGKIINISSISSKIGEYGNGVYSVSKAGINNMVQVLAQELGEYGISVTAVCPGYVNTELLQEAIRTRAPLEGMTPKEYEKHLVSDVPLKRMAEPDEVAKFMLFLSTEYANYITGVSLTMAGGKMLL